MQSLQEMAEAQKAQLDVAQEEHQKLLRTKVQVEGVCAGETSAIVISAPVAPPTRRP